MYTVIYKNCSCISSQRSGLPMAWGVFYGPGVWLDIFAFLPLASSKANVNNLLSQRILGSLPRDKSALHSHIYPSGFRLCHCDEDF